MSRVGAAGGDRPRIRPLTRAALLAELAGRIAGRAPAAGWLRVAVDGAPAAEPERLAAQLVDPLRVRGRAAVWVSAAGFLRPRSLRLERGRSNPEAYYEGWWDLDGLRREVLEPVGPAGSGRYLPSLWDERTDRATRAPFEVLPPGGVLLLGGTLLLGAGLPLDYTIHIELSRDALARRTPPEQSWTLPAYDRYAAEVDPAGWADVVIRANDARRPALVERD